MKHCMIDLETWGKAPGCMIRSIGAQLFELEGPVGSKFYANIVEDERFFKEENTVQWWATQSIEAQAVFTEKQKPLGQVLEEFATGIKAVEGGVRYVWSHGAALDIPILEFVYRFIGIAVPWDFRFVSDTRTWYRAFDFDAKSIPFVGIKHHALHDAQHQVRCVQAAYARRPRPTMQNFNPETLDQVINAPAAISEPASGFGLRFK